MTAHDVDVEVQLPFAVNVWPQVWAVVNWHPPPVPGRMRQFRYH